jgi:hypothetical protein
MERFEGGLRFGGGLLRQFRLMWLDVDCWMDGRWMSMFD